MTVRELSVLRDRVARGRLVREKERATTERELSGARARLDRENAKTGRAATVPHVAIRYRTDAERIQARLDTWRTAKRGKCPGCGGAQSYPRPGSVCWACYMRQRAARVQAPKCGRCGGATSARRHSLCRSCYRDGIEPPHGTISRYTSRRFACRCDPCRQAASEYHRDRRDAMTDWKRAA